MGAATLGRTIADTPSGSEAMSDVATIHNDRGSHDERKLTAHWPTKPAPEVAITAPPAIKIKGRVLAEFADYNGLQQGIRGRVDAMEMTREELDHQSGNQPGYSGKLLGPKQVKKFGIVSLGNTLGGIGCKLLLVEDPEQTAKIMARCKLRERPLRPAKKSRISAAPALPSPPSLTVVHPGQNEHTAPQNARFIGVA
jgi:hypothetical protein